ncbi:DnaJ-related protein rsp1 [Diplogelasinospora grovesii]|uniref:DnaJ-related protein rsp1 n=1 Tax=Diplogelasinospora grovesii TaxID=303347 RepID=A0AAN6N7N7_9PEZI|nr:DnaJ-related protein rsp1 [Diplogelasinospora grovesii]
MVKLDYERDYYRDLELPASADVAEVKKQFKKLALKWHPDRNPGQEDQARDKFVIIQAAHEILTDATLKAKYDAYRKRTSSRYPTSSGVRGNPYSNVSQDVNDRFGPPPSRRPPMPTRPSATTGASRYSGWGVPTSNTRASARETSAAENMRAWERMRNPASGRASPTAPKPPPRPSKTTMDPPPPPSTPRTAAQARRAEASFGIPRRTGFAPASPVGDEPPVKNQHYSTTNIHTSMYDEVPPEAKKQQRPASAFVDPLSEQFKDTFLDNRQSTPYASKTGEKFNPFEGANVNRAKSVRESWRRYQDMSDDDAPPPPPQRQRSASVGEGENGFRKSQSSSNKNAANGGSSGSSSNFGFSSRPSVPYSPPESESAPPTATFGPGSSSSSVNSSAYATVNGGASSKAKDGPTVYDSPPLYTRNGYYFRSHLRYPAESRAQPLHSNSRAGDGISYGQGFGYQNQESVQVNDRPPPSGEQPSPTQNMNTFEKDMLAQLQHLLGKTRTSPPRPPVSSRVHPLSPKRNGNRVTKRTNTAPHNSFTVPDDDDDDDDDDDAFGPASQSQQARFMRNSTDNINTRFVADEKTNGTGFQFNAGGATTGAQDDAFARARQRSRTTPRGRQTPIKNGFTSSSESSINNPHPDEAEQKQGGVGFDPDEWTEKVANLSFVPPTAKPTTSPQRPFRTVKKPKPVRMTAGTAGMVDDEETSSEDKTRPGTSTDGEIPDGAKSPNAMDIDTPPPEPAQAATPATPTPQTNGGARTIRVEPSKPEWRAGDVNGLKSDAAKLGNGLKVPQMPQIPTINPNAAGSEDTDAFSRPMFSGIKNIEPFAPPKPTGLGSFGDLGSTLPFESKAAAKIPIEKEKKASHKPLDFPRAPAAPRPPTVFAIANLKPNAIAWTKYVREFDAYMIDWSIFNNKIVEHFLARRKVVEQERARKGSTWVTGPNFAEYLRWLEEDKVVRQKWMATCDAHELHVREFMKHCERMRQ